MKIAIFLPNWLGDLVMATPALRAIRRHFRRAEIVGIVRPNLLEVLAGGQLVNEQWGFDPRSKDKSHRRAALVRNLRDRRIDLAVLLTNSFHTALLAWLGGARRRAGYARDGRGLLLTDRLPPRRDGRRIRPEPVVETYLRLATEGLGCPMQTPELELHTTAAEESAASAVWQDLRLPNDGRVVALNLSGAYGPSKLWPVEYAADLARRVAERLDHAVLIFCGPQEREAAAQVAALAAHPDVTSLAEQPIGLGLTKACLRRCRAMVTTDSGPRHVAAAFGVPVVTLFGPTLPIWIANPTVRGIDLQLPLDCAGCYERVCPLQHHRCMRDLTPDRVFQALRATLAALPAGEGLPAPHIALPAASRSLNLGPAAMVRET